MEYNWKGKILKQWCLENDLDYHTVYLRFTSSSLSFKDFMRRFEKQIKTSSKISIMVRKKLDGKPIKQICREKDINYSTVMKKMYIYNGDIDRAIAESEIIRDKVLEMKKQKDKNPCFKCMKRNCLGCPNYLYEEQDKQWKAEQYETTKKFD